MIKYYVTTQKINKSSRMKLLDILIITKTGSSNWTDMFQNYSNQFSQGVCIWTAEEYGRL